MKHIEEFTYKHQTLKNGEVCPHCLKRIKLSRVTLNRGHAEMLLNMYKAGQERWHHYKDVVPEGFADYNKLKFWGLVEAREANEDDSKPASGYWKLTYDAVEFILGRKIVPSSAFIFNDSLIEFDDDKKVYFRQLYDEQFDIKEVRTYSYEQPPLFAGVI